MHLRKFHKFKLFKRQRLPPERFALIYFLLLYAFANLFFNFVYMAELKTPTRVRTEKKVTDRTELNTPVKIPASPFLQQIGYGTGVYLGKFFSYFLCRNAI
jgi:hypothetical protein